MPTHVANTRRWPKCIAYGNFFSIKEEYITKPRVTANPTTWEREPLWVGMILCAEIFLRLSIFAWVLVCCIFFTIKPFSLCILTETTCLYSVSGYFSANQDEHLQMQHRKGCTITNIQMLLARWNYSMYFRKVDTNNFRTFSRILSVGRIIFLFWNSI